MARARFCILLLASCIVFDTSANITEKEPPDLFTISVATCNKTNTSTLSIVKDLRNLSRRSHRRTLQNVSWMNRRFAVNLTIICAPEAVRKRLIRARLRRNCLKSMRKNKARTQKTRCQDLLRRTLENSPQSRSSSAGGREKRHPNRTTKRKLFRKSTRELRFKESHFRNPRMHSTRTHRETQRAVKRSIYARNRRNRKKMRLRKDKITYAGSEACRRYHRQLRRMREQRNRRLRRLKSRRLRKRRLRALRPRNRRPRKPCSYTQRSNGRQSFTGRSHNHRSRTRRKHRQSSKTYRLSRRKRHRLLNQLRRLQRRIRRRLQQQQKSLRRRFRRWQRRLRMRLRRGLRRRQKPHERQRQSSRQTNLSLRSTVEQESKKHSEKKKDITGKGIRHKVAKGLMVYVKRAEIKVRKGKELGKREWVIWNRVRHTLLKQLEERSKFGKEFTAVQTMKQSACFIVRSNGEKFGLCTFISVLSSSGVAKSMISKKRGRKRKRRRSRPGRTSRLLFRVARYLSGERRETTSEWDDEAVYFVNLFEVPCNPLLDFGLCTQFCCDDENMDNPFCNTRLDCY